ncbi:hypothetical protein P3S67_014951 [Capsicum chacoense]
MTNNRNTEYAELNDDVSSFSIMLSELYDELREIVQGTCKGDKSVEINGTRPSTCSMKEPGRLEPNSNEIKSIEVKVSTRMSWTDEVEANLDFKKKGTSVG